MREDGRRVRHHLSEFLSDPVSSAKPPLRFGPICFILKKKDVEEVDTCPIRVKSCALRRRVENE